ncbi:polyhydroxyalkanoic acid system family protein [Paludisphaera borealis]|uniref:Polyhydroxyalkanoic acid system protein n=1 Tax=Paludisphaera borealis TaxID=1387353 RepID=A0A1U7CIU1_9BACT|nr:polyhydroxyalkanoic acid system family protein [Paludisphaera borealis]APW58849.1 hypothetical protein BSF38_00256 [Paludisphaera borealis]
MAQVNMSFEHGQPPEVARENFVKGIEKAHAEHGRWIHKVSWSDDRTSAVLTGPSYEVTMSLDDTHVHARGRVPLAFKLFERPVRRYIEQSLEKET